MSGLVSIRREHTLYIVPDRPQTRGDCVHGPRPCPWLGCRYHLASDEHQGMVRVAWERLELAVLGYTKGRHKRNGKYPPLLLRGYRRFVVRPQPTCALDVAAKGEHSSNDVAAMLSLWHTSVEQVTRVALSKFKARMRLVGWGP